MADFFRTEFEAMKSKGRINRLENIAVRKVEPSEVWQEAGTEYVTVLFTANLLDYTLDEKTGQVVGGDKVESCEVPGILDLLPRHRLVPMEALGHQSGRVIPGAKWGQVLQYDIFDIICQT